MLGGWCVLYLARPASHLSTDPAALEDAYETSALTAGHVAPCGSGSAAASQFSIPRA